MQYHPVLFSAVDGRGTPIYHTNVMMWVGTKAAGVCLEAIRDQKAREVMDVACVSSLIAGWSCWLFESRRDVKLTLSHPVF